MAIPGIEIEEKVVKKAVRLGIMAKEGTGKSTVAKFLKGVKLIDDLEGKLPDEVLLDKDCHTIKLGGDNSYEKQIAVLSALGSADKLGAEWLVIDSATSLEKAIFDHTLVADCDNDKDNFVAYGKGYKAANLHFDRFLDLLKKS